MIYLLPEFPVDLLAHQNSWKLFVSFYLWYLVQIWYSMMIHYSWLWWLNKCMTESIITGISYHGITKHNKTEWAEALVDTVSMAVFLRCPSPVQRVVQIFFGMWTNLWFLCKVYGNFAIGPLNLSCMCHAVSSDYSLLLMSFPTILWINSWRHSLSVFSVIQAEILIYLSWLSY